ncbi:MAG TPA: chemotaxis protein CheB [Candidatus Acidoferrales bacterium]|nr:chemotaxis protein CheB [Candidatus Acidoferrales bacterium]
MRTASSCFNHGQKPVVGQNVFTLFLNSLSRSRHPGLDEDGAAALKAFKESGGITIVQEPRSAQRPEMPMAAIDTGCVDYVLAPKAIAAALEEIAAGFDLKTSVGLSINHWLLNRDV